MLASRDFTVFLKRNPRIIVFAVCIAFVLVILVARSADESARLDYDHHQAGVGMQPTSLRYQFQENRLKFSHESTEYDILVVSDMDKLSKRSDKDWVSILKYGHLHRDPDSGLYSVSWSHQKEIHEKLNEAGRSMELSELQYFNGRMLAFDDRTGIVAEVGETEGIIPQYILMDGDGRTSKGFKNEWATVKDGTLYVGSIGKEYTLEDGTIANYNPQWVKTIDRNGRITHIDWRAIYDKLRASVGCKYPGYLVHEAVSFNPVDRKWYFLPRRVSTEKYNDVLDEERGSNIVIVADESFSKIDTMRVGTLRKTHGFSSFKFVPFRENEIVALKSEEHGDDINTFIMVFRIEADGSTTVLMEEQHIGAVKFEGFEFL